MNRPFCCTGVRVRWREWLAFHDSEEANRQVRGRQVQGLIVVAQGERGQCLPVGNREHRGRSFQSIARSGLARDSEEDWTALPLGLEADAGPGLKGTEYCESSRGGENDVAETI